MSTVKSFRALRPAAEYAERVAALPYDVMSSAEARDIAADNPYSFLHIDKAEIDLPEDTGLYDDAVYAKAKENYEHMISDGTFIQDDEPCYYVYRLIRDGHAQTGIAGCVSIDDYENGIVKRHELTRPDKEVDRIRHVDTLDANTGPIYLTCRSHDGLSVLMESWKDSHEPIYDFTADDGVSHTIWMVDGNTVGDIEEMFQGIPDLYLADGHHRCMSAVRVGQMRRSENPGYTGEEEFNFFLSIVFPADQLRIMDYNRVVSDLNGYDADGFVSALADDFEVCDYSGDDLPKPAAKHTFSFYTEGRWYTMSAKPGTWDDDDPKSRLDVSILQENVLAPLLGIDDPRTSDRIDFVGGIRGLEELERRANTDMKISFAMYPTTMNDLMRIADAGLIMPPKSTWFEPKPRSGLLIHKLR